MSTFVLVHGAWYGAWRRHKVVPLPIAAKRAMVKRLPCRTLVWMQTGHSPFLASPERLTVELMS